MSAHGRIRSRRPIHRTTRGGVLHAAMLRVFSAIEPEPDPNDVVGFTRPNPTGYSDWLREGLATTLLLFAVWSEPAQINLAGETGQVFANRVLGELPGLKSDYRLLTSLRNELPLLAEAAPDPLLSALEQMLEGNGYRSARSSKKDRMDFSSIGSYRPALGARDARLGSRLLPPGGLGPRSACRIDPGGQLETAPATAWPKYLCSGTRTPMLHLLSG